MRSPRATDDARRRPEVGGELVLMSWLHVSDIHFGHGSAGHQWDQKLIASDLRRDLAEVLRDGVPAPGHVFVTGDVAFSGGGRAPVGGMAEYDLAERWLDEIAADLDIGQDRVFLVPGNHDVDRAVDATDREMARLVRGVREGIEPIDEVLQHPADVELLRRRMAKFQGFARSFGPAIREDFLGGLWWRHRIALAEGVTLRLCGLNTALLSADDRDHGRLRVGNRQLADLLVPSPDELELVVVLSHHPLTGKWLADEASVRGRFDREAALHLFGHLHEADSEQARHGWGTGCLRIAAGAAHAEEATPDSSPVGHGYNIGALVLLPGGELVVRIWPRRWSSKSTRFVADIDNIDERKGYAEHFLRHRVSRTSAAPLAPGELLGKRYQLVAKLGEGGVGQVWKALDKRDGDEVVAIKVLNPDGCPPAPGRRASFFRGPSEMARVDHPAIVGIRDACPDPQNQLGPYDFYVMDYVEGQNLSEVFRRAPCTEARAIEVMIAIAEGLAAAHVMKVIHRDLKPSNVILGSDGGLTIVDFDTVRDVEDATRTRTGGHLVSDLYASPEVLDGGVVDGRADVYSLAVTGIFLLRGDDPPKSSINRMHELAAGLDLPSGIQALLAKACAHDAGGRFTSIHELLAELRSVAGRLTASPRPERARSPRLARLTEKILAGQPASRSRHPPARPREHLSEPPHEVQPAPEPTPSVESRVLEGNLPTPEWVATGANGDDTGDGFGLSSFDDEPWSPKKSTMSTVVGPILGFVGVLAAIGVLWAFGGNDSEPEGVGSDEAEMSNSPTGGPPSRDWASYFRAPEEVKMAPALVDSSGFGVGGNALVGTSRGHGESPTVYGGLTGTEVTKAFGTGGSTVPTIRQGNAEVQGAIDKDIIRRIVRAHVNEVRHCYNQGLARSPRLAGRVAIQFTIGSDGSVPTAVVAESTINDAAVSGCIAQAVRRWKFPKPQGGGSVIVTYPFVLEPGG